MDGFKKKQITMIGLIILQIIIVTVVSLLWVKVIDKHIEYCNKHPEEKTNNYVDTDNN
jgi:hypothetical protein